MKVHAALISLLINTSMNVDAQTMRTKSSASDEVASHGRTLLRHRQSSFVDEFSIKVRKVMHKGYAYVC